MSSINVTNIKSRQGSAPTFPQGLNVSAGVATFAGNVSVAGTLTYDDVTNIDSVGVVTAGKGLRVTTEGIVVTAGVSTLSGGVDVSTTKPITLGTGTTIHQVASNTLALGTNDETRIQIESDGVTHISNNTTDSLHWNSYNCHLLHTDATDFTTLIENSHDSNPNVLGLHMSDAAPNNGSSTYLQCYDTSGGSTVVRAKITSDGTVTATKFEGPTNVPAGQTGTVTLAASDAGKHVAATGTVTLGTGIFAVGDAVTIWNNSAGGITITLSAVTCYNAADGTTGNRTLGARGLATILCVAANTYVISGSGLT